MNILVYIGCMKISKVLYKNILRGCCRDCIRELICIDEMISDVKQHYDAKL